MAIRVRETITDCLKQAQQSSDDQAAAALQTLVTITKVSPSNRNLVAQTHGAVSLLLELSKKPPPNYYPESVQNLALSVLFNLSLNPTLKHSLAQMDTIHHLSGLLLTASSIDLSKLVASLICSLAMLDKNKAKFGVAGTVQVLVKAISGPRGPSTHYILSSLSELVQFHGNCTLAVRSGAVQILLKLSETAENDDISGSCLTILGLLTRFQEGLSELEKTKHVVPRLLQVLKSGCMLSKEGACEVLLRLFDDHEGTDDVCVREALGLPEFATVVADVSVRGSGRARDKAGLIMKKINQASCPLIMSL